MGMGIVIVDVCDGNAITTINIEEIIEKEFPEASVMMNECLSFCGLCALKPYALVNGKRISGNTPEECIDKIRVALQKELAVFG